MWKEEARFCFIIYLKEYYIIVFKSLWGQGTITRMSNGDVEGGGQILFHHLCMD